MDWNDARLLDQLAYDAKLADFPRGRNRARIADLANGVPPFTDKEVEENGIEVNVNFLELTAKAHDSRAQFNQGFLKPGKYFTASTDYGPIHKRKEWGTIVTKEASRIMRDSVPYFEALRSKFAQLVLHGIAPSVWEKADGWRPRSVGIEDMLLPSGTLVGFENLPYVILYRSFTGMELQKLTKGVNPDPGWNMPLVDALLKWVDDQATQLMHSYWPEVWAPEKQAERMKSNSGFYASDQLPTIDTFDFYFWVCDGKRSGWIRRMILDAWGQPASGAEGFTMLRNTKLNGLEDISKQDFLYSSKSRCVYPSLGNFTSFQFADLSAVAPFRYHSVRSLGFLMYAICHIQNRLRCKFTESIFEALMMYFRVKSMDDAQRALKVDLVNRGFIDETLQWVPANERFQINAALVQLGLMENQRIIDGHAASFSPNRDYSQDRTEKTKFQVMAELNVTTSLVSSALQQAYMYQGFEYREIFRRLCNHKSKEPDIVSFLSNCQRRGVPLKMLRPELWDIEAERIMGSGNKAMELAIAEQLMTWRPLYDPPAQRQILREATLILSDDASKADMLVPEEPKISDSIHDAQLASGPLMMGLPVGLKSGINEVEYVEAMLVNMAVTIQRMQGLPPIEKILGLQNMANHILEHLKVIEARKEEQDKARQLGQQLGQIMNKVKAMAQQLMQAMQKQQQQNGGTQADPEAMAKLQAIAAQAKVKAELTSKSHAQRTAQRQVQFELEQERKDKETAAEIEREKMRTIAELNRERILTEAEASRIKSEPEPESEE